MPNTDRLSPIYRKPTTCAINHCLRRFARAQYATEIKVRAERRCGELLATVDRSSGGRPEKNSSKSETSYQETLRENDLHPATADRYQQLAAMPDDHFETAVATMKGTSHEHTKKAHNGAATQANQPAGT